MINPESVIYVDIDSPDRRLKVDGQARFHRIKMYGIWVDYNKPTLYSYRAACLFFKASLNT